MAKTNGNGTPQMFDEPLSGPEVVARVDAAITQVKTVLEGLLTIRAGIHDLEGLDPKPVKMEPIKRLLLYFDSRHKEALHAPAVIAWGKDNAIMKRVQEAQGDERTETLIDSFFQTRNNYLEQHGWTVQTFAATVPHLLGAAALPVRTMGVTQNTQANRRSSEAAVNMIQSTYGRR